MHLRKLKIEDAPLMLEWMHDDSVVHDLHTNFASKTLSDCCSFIENNQTFENFVNLAIADENDEYMGTVSLKYIDYEESNAEFAITVRNKAMGKGISWYGMKEIIRIAFEEYHLNTVYWCVSKKNARAVKFYRKHGFSEINNISAMILERYADEKDLIWFSVNSNEQ